MTACDELSAPSHVHTPLRTHGGSRKDMPRGGELGSRRETQLQKKSEGRKVDEGGWAGGD